MQAHRRKHLIAVFGILIASILAYAWFAHSSYFGVVSAWSRSNIILFCVLLLLIKTASLIYPPIPGGIATLGAIPFIGWELAYAVYFAGSIIGSTMAFFLARTYGYALLRRLFDEDTIAKVRRIKIYPHREIESIFVLKLLLGATVIEAICYGAGLLNITYKNFIVGTILFHLAVGLPMYYFAHNLIHLKDIPMTMAFIALGMFLFWQIKERYFYFQASEQNE